MTTLVRQYQNYIRGEWTHASTGKQFESVCPSDGLTVATFADSGASDVNQAVDAAREAFDGGEWSSHLYVPERVRLLRQIAATIRGQVNQLAEIESLDSGKPIMETSIIDIHLAADCFEYYADLSTWLGGRQVPLPQNALDYTVREPLGVVAAIVPFNFPLLLASFKLAPALLAGNTVVLKPSEYTSSTAVELAKICDDAGVPAGVVNVLTGFGPALGELLVSHPKVDKVSFTGSTPTGRKVMAQAAKNLTKVSLELGGKGPNIIFADANLEQALEGAIIGAFMNQGEVCIAGARILVEESIYDEFLRRFVERANRLPVGHSLDWNTRVGALINEAQFEKVCGFIDRGSAAGAKMLCGGRVVQPELAHGFFVAPTVFTDVNLQSELSREEIFGPVACVIPFSSEEDAIRVANDSDYGLAGAVWTENIKRGLRVARRLRLGTVWVNQYNRLCVEAPFGGVKQSGMGRELGIEALYDYTQVKNIYVELEDEILTLYE